MNDIKSFGESEQGRRDFLKLLLTGSAVAAAAGPISAFAKEKDAKPSTDLELAAATMGLISSTVSAVMPETTEGPYYLDPKLVRSDITDGRKGIPLRMKLQVITADCRPVKGARVDIWHCDATGNYSGFQQQPDGKDADTTRNTFLRGTQMADAHGIVTFETIYPGWYQGRTTHIHHKVFLDKRTVLTSQIFFPDALSEYIYDKSTAYNRKRQRDTLNSIDDIASQAGEGAYAAIREQKDRYIAALVVGVDPNATWSERGQGMGWGGSPPGGGPPPGGGRPPGPPPGGGPPPMGERDWGGGPGPGGPGGPEGPRGRRDASTRIFPGS